MARFSVDGAESSANRSRKRRERSPVAFYDEEIEPISTSDEETEQKNETNSSRNSSGFILDVSSEPLQNRDTTANGSDSVNLTRTGLSVTLADSEVLDCAICCEALAPPVYQCDNGHIACSSCCLKMKNICPFCQMPIGYSRCRAFEKVLQSITLSCKNAIYGCQEALSYSNKSVHEETCMYAPFRCPFSDCGFFDSSEHFKLHLSDEHETPVLGFLYNSTKHIFLKKKMDEHLFLREETVGTLFILSSTALNSGSTHVGNVVAVNSIGSSLLDKEVSYNLEVDTKETCIKLVCMTNRIVNLGYESSVMGHLFVPAALFNSSGNLKVKLTLLQEETSSMRVWMV